MTAFFLLAAAFYGLAFDPVQTNAPSSARIYPTKFGVYRMVQPDGQRRSFQVVDYEKGLLAGDRPWVGVIRKNRIDIWADPDLTGGKLRTGYTFVDGLLRMMKLDGRVFTFPVGNPKLDGTLESLFPVRKVRSMEKNGAGDIWRDSRFRLWFANPNCAGLFLAQCALFFAACVLLFRGCCKIPFAFCAVFSIVLMMETGSRGALLALGVGLLCLASVHVRRLLTRRGIVLGLVMLAAVVLVVFIGGQGGGRRILETLSSFDCSSSLRMRTAKAAVMMFADAPFGWKGGEIPGRSACLNWYLFADWHILRTYLISLAELGWLKGFACIFGWAFLLVLSILTAGRNRAIPLSFLMSFLVAGFFNPVYIAWEVWIAPFVSCALIIWSGLSSLDRRRFLACGAASALMAVAAVALLVVVGNSFSRPTAVPLRVMGPAVFINGDKPVTWVVEDQAVLGGTGFPGREILTHYVRHPKSPCLAYVHDLADLPESVDSLVLPGRAAADFLRLYRERGRMPCRAGKILFLSPSVGPDVVPDALPRECRILWIVGYFAALRDPAYAVEREWVSIRLGAELYFPNWVALCFAFRP